MNNVTPPHPVPTPMKPAPIHPMEIEVNRLQKLLNEQQAQVLETSRKLQEALKSIPERTQPGQR